LNENHGLFASEAEAQAGWEACAPVLISYIIFKICKKF
jgi:hypothetical protein